MLKIKHQYSINIKTLKRNADKLIFHSACTLNASSQRAPLLCPGTHLYDGITELQGVHELNESREKEPVIFQKAVPFLTFLFELCRQRRVETTEPGCKYLCSDIKISSFPKFLARNSQLPGDANVTGPKTALQAERYSNIQKYQLARKHSTGDGFNSSRRHRSTRGIWLTRT